MISSPPHGQERNEEGDKKNFQQSASSIGRKTEDLLDEMHWTSLGRAWR
jgi:hypothetical protein